MYSKIIALMLPALSIALPQSASAPSPDQISIVDTSYSGNGCPQGSVSTSTSPDKTVSIALHVYIQLVPALESAPRDQTLW